MMNNKLLPEHYLNHFLVRQCGVPDNNRTWTVSRKVFDNMLRSWTLGSGAVYVKSQRENKDLSLSLKTGEVIWSCDVSDNDCEGVSLIGEYICMGYYVHHVCDGRIIYDLRELVDKKLAEFQYFIPFRDGFLCRASGERSRIVYVDLQNGTVDDFPIDLKIFRVTDDQRYLFGWLGREICCIDAESKAVVWSCLATTDSDVEPIHKASFTVHGDKVYLYKRNKEIECLDVSDGAVNWKINLSDQQAVNQNSHDNSVVLTLVCGNGALVLERFNSFNGYIEVLSPHNGDLFWRADMVLPHAFIAGNTVIVIYGDDGEHIQMRDLFTGEVLWEMPKALSGMVKVLAWGNKIVVSTVLGTFRCFEWSEPYCSPARK